jgi:hypothetical protein
VNTTALQVTFQRGKDKVSKPNLPHKTSKVNHLERVINETLTRFVHPVLHRAARLKEM